MRLLLDTHILLRTAAGKLSSTITQYVNDKENKLFFSSASIWEIGIKHALNRNDFVVDPNVFYKALLDAGYVELPIIGQHAVLAASLPMLHKDPFDRILLAQATIEGISLLTSDEIVARYEGPVLFVK
ncbi:MAG: type II toxin-antitoxin system VapC family toxin [Fusobacteriaceae bacterium]|jgi:PIN domain nuclease of toxin-antitoxin system|nr:type II toxin-antitoxin system VapC family toxin [Fusobacteriaceae bacterium]